MRGEKHNISLHSQQTKYVENGFRILSSEETLYKIHNLLLSTNLEIKFERRWIENTLSSYYILHIFTPTGDNITQRFLGKGLSDEQCMISAVMECIERLSARMLGEEALIESSFNKIKNNACDPSTLILPLDTPYTPDLEIDWVWGYSLTQDKPTMIPASFVFLPYSTDKPTKVIRNYTSNGLAAGNCIEEAILHGLLEIVERDAHYIMEYNKIIMPDVVIDLPENDPISHFLNELKKCNIHFWIKYITNNIPIPSFGILLQGMYKHRPTYSYAVGTHLDPRIALSRALTEALQMYPHCSNYDAWLSSGPIDHLDKSSNHKINFSEIDCPSSDDLKVNIENSIKILQEYDAEIIVVDLSITEMMFSVVRVCITNLQPEIFPINPCYSKRLFETPVLMGYREDALKPEDITPREICGFAWKT